MPLARHVAGQLMQTQRNGQALLAGHKAITLNLLLQCAVRTHVTRIKSVSDNSAGVEQINSKSAP